MTRINHHELSKWADEKISSGKYPDHLSDDQREEVDDLLKYTPANNLSIDKRLAWQKVSDRISTTTTVNKKTGSLKYWSIAAVITLLIVSGISIQQYLENTSQEISYNTGSNSEQITLIDGSIITLNEQSTLVVSEGFNNKSREVTLTGEAFFSIQKSESKLPFTIQTDHGHVMVLGTVFNVKTASKNTAKTSVYVQSGTVSLSDSKNEKEIKLVKGEIGSLDQKNTLTKISANNENMLFWKTQKLSFKSEKLSDIVSIVSKHLNTQIKIDESIQDCIITINFQGNNIDKFLSNLKKIKDIQINIKDGIYHLSGDNCL